MDAGKSSFKIIEYRKVPFTLFTLLLSEPNNFKDENKIIIYRQDIPKQGSFSLVVMKEENEKSAQNIPNDPQNIKF